MTIRIEREALLRLLSAPPSTPLLEPPIRYHDEYEYVNIAKPAFSGDFPIEKDDDSSVVTASTASLSCDTDDGDYDRRVSFAEDLVTDEWTREYTPRDDVADLFYSPEEMQRFRQEYRLERKLLSDLSLSSDDLATETDLFSKLIDTKREGRHQISRVVILHNNKLEAFSEEDVAPNDTPDSFDFDNEAFWSGNITWFSSSV